MVLMSHMTVGQVAEQLGLATATLRSWERRYGLGPSGRSPGGHRRYTSTDLGRLRRVSVLVAGGMSTGRAAHLASESAHVIAADEAEIQAMLDGTQHFRGEDISRTARGAIDRLGVVLAWDRVFAPALAEIGRRWESGQLGVENEHLLTSRLLQVLRSRPHVDPVRPSRPVLVASAEDDQHKLPMVAAEAALTSRGVETIEFGSRLPSRSLATIARALEPTVVMLWASVSRPSPDPTDEVAVELRTECEVIFAGPGWPEPSPYRNLSDAVDHIVSVARPAGRAS